MKKWLIAILIWMILAHWARADELLDRPVRGLSTMHCFANQEQCLKLCDVLYDAKIKNIAINFIADGSFGYNLTSYRYCVDKLTSGGRNLTAIIYAHSGPGARRWHHYKRLKIKSWASGIRPEFINARLRNDPSFRESYQANLKTRVKPLVDYGRASGAHVAIGWLEDNFTNRTFKVILNLTSEVFKDYPIEYVRNPLFYTAGSIPSGVVRETHSLAIPGIPANSWVFNDGEGFKFLHERPRDDDRSLADIYEVRKAAEQRGSSFILWVGQYQGDNGKIVVNPLQRKYRLPKRSERREILQFLRE